MPEDVEDPSEPDPEIGGEAPGVARGPVFSRYGVASALLGLLCAAAVALLALIWSHHHGEVADRTRQTDAMQAAADWTGVLINMNKDNVETSLQKLRDGTVGQLNADFEASVQPYRDVVKTLQSQTTGQIDSVAIESVHHDLDAAPGTSNPPSELPAGMASRTDTVLVVATAVSQNVGGQPQTVHWNLRLDVSDVDGRLLVSRLESIR